MRLWILGLPVDVKFSDQEFQELVSPFGEVKLAKVIIWQENGLSRGYGFVEMVHDEDVLKVKTLDGKMFQGRTLRVAESRPAKE